MDENMILKDEAPAEAGEVKAPEAAEQPDVEAKLAGMLAGLRADMEGKVRAALDEALRLNAMSPEERSAWEARDRERALAEREQALARREARADVLEGLARRGLPAALADAVRCDTPEDAAQSLAALEAAFGEAVQAAVEARLKGNAPAAGASAQDDADALDDASYYRMQAMGRGGV